MHRISQHAILMVLAFTFGGFSWSVMGCVAQSCTTPDFSEAINFDVGRSPRSIALGDFNEDGRIDIAVANLQSANVSIMLGTGIASFSAPTNFEAGQGPTALTVSDFNGDGNSDLALVSHDFSNIAILLGTGTGNFGPPRNFPLAAFSLPDSLAVGDFNGDGKSDLAVTNNGSGTIAILLGDGNGNLGSATNFAGIGAPQFVAVGDFDRDGKSDLAVANSDRVSILMGDGTGAFAAPIMYAVGRGPAHVAIGDFNGDGNSDLAVANYDSGMPSTVSILLGTGNGTFSSATGVPAGLGPLAIGIADFNNDGNIDLSVAGGSATVSILLGAGTGSFSAPVAFPVGFLPISLAVSDFTNDGVPDIAVSNLESDTVSILLNSCSVSNPIDDTTFFVSQQYRDFLNRAPDPDGWDYWKSQINLCGTDQLCISARRIRVADAFFFENEFQQTGSYVFRLYRAAYGDQQPFANPDVGDPALPFYPGPDFHLKFPSFERFRGDRSQIVVGAGLAQSKLDLANSFVERPEFTARYPLSLSSAEFVTQLLSTIHNAHPALDPVPVDLNSQSDTLVALCDQSGRGAVLYRLADDDATNPINNRVFIDAEYNITFVANEYFGFFRRDGDANGLNFWITQINRYPLRNEGAQHAMACSQITSAEYQLRFSNIISHTNEECQQ